MAAGVRPNRIGRDIHPQTSLVIKFFEPKLYSQESNYELYINNNVNETK